VVKQEWGTKRTCQACESRFYDLNKIPIICPKCQTPFEIVASPKSGISSSKGQYASYKTAHVKEEIPSLVDDGEEDDDLIEDTDEFGEEFDDVASVSSLGDEDKE
jgi:uncharacterized protein (TIGR02300 family)